MTPRYHDGAEGERLKDAALGLLEAHREDHLRAARRALLVALLERGTATADDVRAAVELPPGVDPKCFGAVPGVLSRAGIIRQVGFCKTCRAVGHARPLAVWELVDAAKAERWLAAHPPRKAAPQHAPDANDAHEKTPAAIVLAEGAAGALDGSNPLNILRTESTRG